MKKLLAVALLALVAATGCTTSSVGQVVTNVNPDGRGGVLIEKGTLKQRKYMWTYVTDIWVEDFQTGNIHLGGN